MALNSKNNMLRDYVIQYFPNIMITGTIKVVYNEGVTEFGISELGTLVDHKKGRPGAVGEC
jgi:hypothetical protein